MLAKIAPRFVISRVIQNSYSAESQAVELLKASFGFRDEYFNLVDPQDYQVNESWILDCTLLWLYLNIS